MNMFALCVGLLLFGLLYVWIGLRASREQKTKDDYFLMGRKLTVFPLCMTLLATQVGGGTFIGAAEEAYRYGWIVLIYPLGAAIGFCALGMGFGGRLRELNIATTAELFETVYGSRLLRQLASILSMVALYLTLVGQGIATNKFFATLGIMNPLWFVLFWAIFVTYTVMGGLKAVIKTDVLQALIILVAVGALWFSIDFSPLSGSMRGRPVEEIPWLTAFSSWFSMPLLFMLIEQDMGQRCFAARSSSSVAPAAFGAALLLMASSTVAIVIGVLAAESQMPITPGESVLVAAVTSLVTPSVATLFIAAIFMAIASTADSLLCSIGSNLTYDFLASHTCKDGGVALSRWITLAIGMTALGMVYLFDNVLTMLFLGYSLCVCMLCVPIVVGVLCRSPSRGGALCSVIVGGASFVSLRLVGANLPIELVSLGLSAFGYLLGSRLYSAQAVMEVTNG